VRTGLTALLTANDKPAAFSNFLQMYLDRSWLVGADSADSELALATETDRNTLCPTRRIRPSCWRSDQRQIAARVPSTDLSFRGTTFRRRGRPSDDDFHVPRGIRPTSDFRDAFARERPPCGNDQMSNRSSISRVPLRVGVLATAGCVWLSIGVACRPTQTRPLNSPSQTSWNRDSARYATVLAKWVRDSVVRDSGHTR
jgi:hypothetical protein